jgi:predicted nucleic acid-binding protein
MIVVSDTTPISSLVQIGAEALLRTFCGSILIPSAVDVELRRFHTSVSAWISVRPVSDLSLVSKLPVELDPGEAEAIALVKETRADSLLTD